jgi:S1-C subfamily serine protease
MRRSLVAAVVVAAAGLAASARADDDPLLAVERAQQRVFDAVAPSVVFLDRAEGYASGFAVAPDLVLTSAHVVGAAKEVDAILSDGSRRRATVVERAADDTDLALVRIAGAALRPLALATYDLRVGAWVGAVGHGVGGAWTFTVGMVSNIYPRGADRPVFQTQIPLNPGNSGGPIVDREGRVIGVVTAGIKEAQSVNFAIRTQVACRTLAQLRPLCDVLTIRAPAGVAVFVDGRSVGVGPTVVVPAEKRTYKVMVVVGGKLRERQVTFPAQRMIDLGAN